MAQQPSGVSKHTINTNDEIDLLDLISTLWKRKFLIILIAAIGFWGAYGLSLLMQEKWRSSAIVVAPRIINTEELLEYKRAVSRITNPNSDISVSDSLSRAFNTFLYTAANSDEKYSYLSETDLFNRLMEGTDRTAVALLDEMSRRIDVELPNEEDQALSTGYTLSFISDDAESAQATLTGYIAHVNKVAIETFQKEYSNSLKARIDLRKQQVHDIEQSLHNKRVIAIDNYKDALLTAQKAGIKSAPGSLVGRADTSNNLVLEINASPPPQLYMQGEEVLQALLDVTQTEPIIYPENYHRLKYEIEALEPLVGTEPQFQSFNYLMRPSLPVRRDAPKRAQIAVVGGLVGGVLATLYALISAAFANRRNKSNSA